MTRTRKLQALAATLLAAVTLTARAAGDEEIRVGACQPITGRFAFAGVAINAGLQVMARRCSFCLNVTLAVPSMVRSLSSGTLIGPGESAVPGTGCGNAVERAVWNVTLPSTFCIT